MSVPRAKAKPEPVTQPGGTDSRTFGNVRVITTPIPPMDAIDLIPELLSVLGPGGAVMATDGTIATDGATIGDALGMMARALIGGRITHLLPRILAGSTLVIPGAKKIDLVSLDAINEALTLRPDMLIPLVWVALEVQFKRFFPGFGLLGLKIPTLSRSQDSNPSTNDTGPSID